MRQRLEGVISLKIGGKAEKSFHQHQQQQQSILGNEERNDGGNEEIRHEKRPMDEGEEDKVKVYQRKKKARNKSGGGKHKKISEIRLNAGEEQKEDKGKGKMHIFESGEVLAKNTNTENPFALKLDREESFEVQQNIVDIMKIFWPDMKDGREDPLKLLYKVDNFANYKSFLLKSGSPKVDELMKSIKNNLINDGFNPEDRHLDLCLCWSMLSIGRQIISGLNKMGIEIDTWGWNIIVLAIKSIENWASKMNLPTNDLAEAIQIKIIN